jgi:hypothetical protein
MEEIHSVSLYEIDNLSIVEMSIENLFSYVNETASWIFIDNVHLNESEILDFEINSQSKIEIICDSSWSTGYHNVTLHKPFGEIVHQRMTTLEVHDEINDAWVLVDGVFVFRGVGLPVNEGSVIKISFNDTPHDKILIGNHDYPLEHKFRTRVSDASGGTLGFHTLAEINKKIPAPDVTVDGERISFPITVVELHEQSEFNFIPPLRGGCSQLDCGCGGVRRHDVRRITQGLVDKGKSDNGCWSAEQLYLLGITDECHLGDNETIQNRIGHLIMAGNYEKFVNLKNCHLGD